MGDDYKPLSDDDIMGMLVTARSIDPSRAANGKLQYPAGHVERALLQLRQLRQEKGWLQTANREWQELLTTMCEQGKALLDALPKCDQGNGDPACLGIATKIVRAQGRRGEELYCDYCGRPQSRNLWDHHSGIPDLIYAAPLRIFMKTLLEHIPKK